MEPEISEVAQLVVSTRVWLLSGWLRWGEIKIVRGGHVTVLEGSLTFLLEPR